MTHVTDLNQAITVDRRSELSQTEFVKEYQNPDKSVILTDFSKDWSASTTFTFEFFEQQFGDRYS